MKYLMRVAGTLEQLQRVQDFCKGAEISCGSPKSPDDYKCRDCGNPAESYMVHTSVWKEAQLLSREHCCLRCLEVRLGRVLKKSDLPEIPINNLAHHSYDI